MTSGCKPVYVFDGKPPDMKGGTLAKRSANRLKAEVGIYICNSIVNYLRYGKFHFINQGELAAAKRESHL